MASSIDQFRSVSTDLLSRIENTNTRGMYRKGLTDFLAWWVEQGGFRFDEVLLESHLRHLAESNYSPATINQRLAAIRKLISEAAALKLLDFKTAVQLMRVKVQ